MMCAIPSILAEKCSLSQAVSNAFLHAVCTAFLYSGFVLMQFIVFLGFCFVVFSASITGDVLFCGMVSGFLEFSFVLCILVSVVLVMVFCLAGFPDIG